MLTETENINLNPKLPLIICDADEVIFHFMDGFEKFLYSQSLYFSYESFKLSGNIKKIDDNSALESDKIPRLINIFFQKHTLTLKFIDGSKNNLIQLSKNINIIILTNMPKEYIHQRIKALEKNNMFFDVICNEGPKGKVCAELEKKTKKPVFFIDDSPSQIASVSSNCKNIFKIHFLQHPRLIKICPKSYESDFNATNWKDIKKIILKNI